MIETMKLFKRNGIYYIRFYRAKEKSLRTRDEGLAKAIFKEVKREWLRGKLLQLDHGKRVTLSEFAKEYLARDYASIKTYKADELALRLLADVVGGSTALRAINSRKIEKFKKACSLRDCKPSTVRAYLRHIKAALGVAEDWYGGYKRPKIKIGAERSRPRPIPIPHLKKLEKKADRRLKPIIIFALWTGTRRNEILRVQWTDVHLGEKPHVRITGKGDRERLVPLLPKVLRMLKRMRKDIGPVFVQVHPDTITHWFRDLARECNIQPRFHDLRHSAATYMLASGTPLEIVQKVLGHEHISTTQIYADVLEEMIQEGMKLEI